MRLISSVYNIQLIYIDPCIRPILLRSILSQTSGPSKAFHMLGKNWTWMRATSKGKFCKEFHFTRRLRFWKHTYGRRNALHTITQIPARSTEYAHRRLVTRGIANATYSPPIQRQPSMFSDTFSQDCVCYTSVPNSVAIWFEYGLNV